MRRDNNRRLFNLNSDDETKKMLYISGGILAIAILAFIITFIVYGNMLKNDDELAKINSKSITDLGKVSTGTQIEETSSSIGKSVNEVKEDMNNTVNNEDNSTKIAINTSNMEKDNKSNQNALNSENTNSTESKTSSNSISQNQNANSKPKEEKEPSFAKPVQGKITKDFAKDTLIYSETLKEWITHMGIDIKADKTTVVKSAEEGTIKSIKNDPRYGITVVIEHAKGYTTIYSNLLTAEFVKEGEKVTKGQTIGTVGNTATFEIADEPHLHFEILKDGEYVDPNLYLK